MVDYAANMSLEKCINNLNMVSGYLECAMSICYSLVNIMSERLRENFNTDSSLACSYAAKYFECSDVCKYLVDAENSINQAIEACKKIKFDDMNEKEGIESGKEGK